MYSNARVGPYRILRLINRGGQGSVFLGYDSRLRRRVAIKISKLPKGFRARRDVFREARAVAALDSPRVVAVHDVIESPRHIALIMEYVPGCDLEELLSARRLSLASVVNIASDIAAALIPARKVHLVHGDLKAANILITESGRATLTDFGIAQRGNSGPARGGSPSALSPEQCRGGAIDSRSDLFALGCLLYRMLSGEAPFHARGVLDVRWLLERPPLPLADRVAPEYEVPQDLTEEIMHLLATDPVDRPSSTRRLRGLLREVRRELPLSQESNLLAEARPFFRPESTEDIPPPVPADLGHGTRSRLARVTGWQLLFDPGWRRVVLPVLLVLTLALPVVLVALQSAETSVYIESPALDIEKLSDLPADVSSRWLVEQVKSVLSRRLGALRVSGPIGATPATVYHADMDASTDRYDERVELFLHCRDRLCAFAVSREHAGERNLDNATLLPGMSMQQWGEVVSAATDRLYD